MFGRAVVVALGVIACVSFASLAHAQVSVNIGINLPGPPSLVIIPRTPVAYAPAVPANLFFYGGQDYLFANNDWYMAPTYNGPWVVVAPAYLPRPILAV